MTYGFTGAILSVDLSSGKKSTIRLSADLYRDYIGGSGLASKIRYDKGRFDADPFSPENALYLMNGPFAGTSLPGASRFYVAGRSPLTHLWADSACGGDFAARMKFAGYDGIILEGESPEPVYLLIEDGEVELLTAQSLWGKDTYETTDRLLENHQGRKTSVLTIGPAGENRVRYASIHNNKAHACGRAGFGAIMGAKKIKAVVIKAAPRKISLANPEGFKELQKRLARELKEGMVTQVLGTYGTSAAIGSATLQGDLPTKNWASPSWEEAIEKMDCVALSQYLTGTHSCWVCPVGCKRITEVKSGRYITASGPGPEYETIVSMGQLCLNDDLESVIKMNEMLNRTGMDSISFGATIAWAMECYERGILSEGKTEGLDLSWANAETIITLIDRVARREGSFADLLAEGSERAATVLGDGSTQFLTTVKGMEAPMHDPRAYFGLGLAYAAGSNRGACHMSTHAMDVESGVDYFPEIGLDEEYVGMSNDYKAEMVAGSAFLGSIHSSASICKFAQHDIQLSDYVELFNCAAGHGWGLDEMMDAAQRVWYLKRILNHSFGFQAWQDRLPQRLTTLLAAGRTEGMAPDMGALLKEFYQIMDLDPETGRPSPERLRSLGLEPMTEKLGEP